MLYLLISFGLLKSLETLPKQGISADFAVRDFAQQTARKQALQKTGGTEDDILEAIAARTRATEPLRESALGQAGKAVVGGVTSPLGIVGGAGSLLNKLICNSLLLLALVLVQQLYLVVVPILGHADL